MAYPTFRLDERVAVVTGAGQGIGRAVALGLANAGASVAATDSNPELLPEVERALEALGRPGLTFTMDVRDPDSIRGTMDRVMETYGRLDVLVNNAGIRLNKSALDHSLEDWNSVLAVNTTGVFLCSQAAARAMRESGGGSIINISSISAIVVGPNQIAYCVSKAAVAQMTRVMAVEWAQYNIRVNAIAPGLTKTPYTEAAVASGVLGGYLQNVPMGRAAEAEELIGTFVYLASDASSFVTGAFIPVDGGRLLI